MCASLPAGYRTWVKPRSLRQQLEHPSRSYFSALGFDLHDAVFLQLIKKRFVIDIEQRRSMTPVPADGFQSFQQELGFRAARGFGKLIKTDTTGR